MIKRTWKKLGCWGPLIAAMVVMFVLIQINWPLALAVFFLFLFFNAN